MKIKVTIKDDILDYNITDTNSIIISGKTIPYSTLKTYLSVEYLNQQNNRKQKNISYSNNQALIDAKTLDLNSLSGQVMTVKLVRSGTSLEDLFNLNQTILIEFLPDRDLIDLKLDYQSILTNRLIPIGIKIRRQSIQTISNEIQIRISKF